MQFTTPQPKQVSFLRRWRVPIAASLIANLLAIAVSGDWFSRHANTAGVAFDRHVYILPPLERTPQKPPTTTIPQIKRPPRDNQPESPVSRKHTDASAARAGARHAQVHSAVLPHVTPHSAAPQNQERDVDRDPFQPDVAPAVLIPQPTRAQHTVTLPTPPPTPPTIKPTQIAQVTGTGVVAQTPSPAPTPTAAARPASGAAGDPGAVRVGSGANGQGERGEGPGGGGVVPFGGGGGRGGEGDHHILYVLDFSPSMVSRMPDLRRELEHSMANLTQDDLFDIFAFGDQVIRMEDYLEPATPDSLAEARRFMNSVGTIQGTNIEEVMLEALALHHTNEIVLITDGVPNEGETNFKILEADIRQANYQHVRIDTIGLIGVNEDSTAADAFAAADLLKTIAQQSGGTYQLQPLGIDSPE